MKILLKNGTIVNADGTQRADVLICNDKIKVISPNLESRDAELVDCSGKLLFPGFIDAHTHFDLDVCNTTTADDFYTGGKAAIRGGTTLVIDFACPNKGESLQYGLDLWHKKADGKTACDYSFHMTIDDWNDTIKAQIPDMVAQGVTSFKMYLTYPAMMIGDGQMLMALQELKKYGCIAGVHCENAGMIDALIQEQKDAGHTGPEAHPLSRPDMMEAEAVGRLLKMAYVADVPVVVVHTTCEAALKEIEAARARGQTVYVETCPQYLVLDDSRYLEPDFAGAKYVCAPPLRKRADQDALWQAIADGAVQTVSTDHCSFTLKQKDAGRGDFTKIPGGLPGVETRGVLLYTYGVRTGRISLEKMAEVLCANPAKLYGVWPRKGVISEGSDADIVVYDPVGEGVITSADQIANVDYSPYEGFAVKGRITRVYLRGHLAVLNGDILADQGGTFIPRGLPNL